MNEFILTLKCADARGIVASFATGLLELDANIIANKQFTDHATNTFVMRAVFEDDLEDPREIAAHLKSRVQQFDAELRREGLVVAGSYGPMADKVFRLGHMGTQADTALMVQTIDVIAKVLDQIE